MKSAVQLKPVRPKSKVDFEGVLRGSPLGSADSWADPPDWMGGGEGEDDFLTRGVKAGYDLLHEQLNRGQDFAHKVTRGFGSSTPDLRGTLEPILRSFAEMYINATLMWLDFLPLGQPRGGRGPREEAGRTSIPVEVIPQGRGRGAVQLRAGASTASLCAVRLWSRDPTKPPLSDVSFQPTGTGGVYLQVRIPDNQPSDLYLGVVCDENTGEPLGTTSVLIQAR